MPDPTRSQPPAVSVGDIDTRPDAAAGPPPAPLPAMRFVLGDEIARGAMGVVHAARDTHLSRDVAVKVLQPHLAGTAAERRFLDEARITGQLQHPGIPPVYDLGTLPDDRPFLALKLIKGDTLDVLLRRDGPGGRWLGVFEGIAQAVGYAHAHGVIHRDLKPANVMVGAFGEVQVMDWGLAKLLTVSREAEPSADPDATTDAATAIASERGVFDATRAGSVMGTPAYMAPEQAIGAVDQMDRRTDVFGLGALLCAFLTGKPPYQGGDAESTRQLAAQAKLTDAFARLDVCGAELEVVALCRRCLSVDKSARPADAGAVATAVATLRAAADDRARRAEVERGQAEVRAAEQAKRRRAIQWVAGAVAAVLLVGVGGTTAGLVWADERRLEADQARRAEADQRSKAEAAKTLAEAKETEANAVVEFFMGKVFAAARPKRQAGGLGADVLLRDAIEAALPVLATGFKDQPLVEARLRLTLGATFRYLGEHKKATEQGELARTIYTELRGPDHPDTLLSMNNLAINYADLNRQADALKLREETLAARRRVLSPDHPDTLASMHSLANSYSILGRYPDALKINQETLAARRRVLSPDHPDTLLSMNNLAVSYTRLGRQADALELREETLATRRRVLSPDHPDTLISMHNLANSYTDLGRHADALKLREETLSAQKRVLPPDHPDTLKSMWGVAGSLVLCGRGAEAIPLIDECATKSVGKVVDPRMIPSVFALRLTHFKKVGDPAGCRATAVMWEQFGRLDADSLYAATCWRALAADAYANANQPAEATADADLAMAWLAKAVAAGYRDRAHMLTDLDLAPLRGRADFRTLLATIPEQALPPRPAR